MVVEWLDANKLRAFDNRDALCLWLAVCAAGTPAYEMVNPPVTDPDPDPTPDVKNGIVAENGSLYYYVDGKLTAAGLIEIDGDYYYVNSSCKVVTTSHYWVNRSNGLLPAGFYDFGADGKMVK